MPATHQEVVELVINNAKFSQGLKKAAEEMVAFKKAMRDYNFGYDVNGEGLSAAEFGRLAQAKANADLAAKKKTQAEIERLAEASDKKEADRLKFNLEHASKLRKAQFAERAADEKHIATEIHKYREEGRREDLSIAKALHAYRIDAIKEELAIAKALHDYRSSAPKSGVNFTASQAARVGAGAAVATGNYNLGGGLYAAANVLQTTMPQAFQVSTASALAFGAAVTGPAVLGGMMLYGKEFNVELAKMSTLLADANMPAAEFRDLLNSTANSAVVISNKFNIDLIDVVKGFKDALSAGIDAKDLQRFTDVAATLATSLDTSLGDATNILTTFKDSYGYTISELTKVNDLLFNSVDVGKISIKDMTANLSRVIPIAEAAKISTKDLFLGIDVMTRKGLSTPQSITSMTQFIHGLVNPSEKAAKALHALGIETGDLAFKNKSLQEVLEKIKAVTGGSGELLGKLFPEERGERGAALMIQSLGMLFDSTSKGLDKVGTAAKGSDRAMNTLWANLGKVAAALSNPIKVAGGTLADWINKLAFGGEEGESNRYKNSGAPDAEDALKRKFQRGEDVEGWMKKQGEFTQVGASVVGKSVLQAAYEKTKAEFEAAGVDAGQSFLKGVGEGAEDLTAQMKKTLDKSTDLLSFKDPSKAENKALGNALDASEKNYIENLEFENEAIKEQIDLKKSLILVEAQKQLAPLIDDVNNAKGRLVVANEGRNPYEIAAAKNQLQAAYSVYSEIVKKLMNDMTLLNGAEGIVAKFNENVLKIKTLRDAALGRTEGKNLILGDISKFLDTSIKHAKKEHEKESQHYVDTYKKAIHEIAEEESRENRKVMAEKRRLIASLKEDEGKNQDRHVQFQQDQWGRKFQNSVSGSDEGRNKHSAIEARDEIHTQIQAAIAGSATQEVFKDLAERFKVAMQAVADNTADKDRGKKNMAEDEAVLAALESAYTSKYSQDNQSKQDDINKKYTEKHKSKFQIQKEALAKADDIKKEKTIISAEIHLQVDGTVSKETLDNIAATVLRDFNKAHQGGRLTSPYDRPSRDGNNLTASDDEEDY